MIKRHVASYALVHFCVLPCGMMLPPPLSEVAWLIYGNIICGCLEVLNNLKFTLCHTWVLVDVGKDHHPIVKDAFVQDVLKITVADVASTCCTMQEHP